MNLSGYRNYICRVNKNTALRILFTANGISSFAQGISMLAIPWYFATNTSYFNTAYGLITIAVLFFGLYAGTIVDKYSRKTNFMGNSLVCGILLLVIALVGFWQGYLQDFFIVAVFAITMLNYNIHYPTLYAFGQEISDAKNYSKVNSNIEVVGQSMSVLSGGIAAIMLEGFTIQLPFSTFSLSFQRWNIWEIFLLNAITYFLAAIFISFIKYTPQKLHVKHEPILIRLKQGFSYLNNNTNVLWFGLLSYSVFAMVLVEIHAVLPAYINNHLHAKGNTFAIADGVYAVGALAAGLWINKIFDSNKTERAVIILTVLSGFIFLWAFWGSKVWIIYTVCVLFGFSNAGIRVLRLTYLFHHIPNELMGRVNSVFNMCNIILRSLFIFLFSSSFFAVSNQIIWAYLIMALFLFISATGLFINQKKSTKRYE